MAYADLRFSIFEEPKPTSLMAHSLVSEMGDSISDTLREDGAEG